MFRRLPGEYEAQIVDRLDRAIACTQPIIADIRGVMHLGAGVAFAKESPALESIRATLKGQFLTWLGPQNMQPWRSHITIQNKVARTKADALHRDLQASFRPWQIEIVGLDLWAYLDGPCQHMAFEPFAPAPRL